MNSADWTLINFDVRFDSWVELEAPSDDLRVIVMDWVMTCSVDPYQGVKREPDQDNLWYGRIPDSGDGCGNVVVCSYWIEESTHTVRCNGFTTLSHPA